MTVLTDNMICHLCKGKKVILNEASGKMDICPKCKGTGKLIPEEQENIKRNNLLFG